MTGIPGVDPYTFPALWFMFDNMGQLIDALSTWGRTHPLVGQMAAVNDFLTILHGYQWKMLNFNLFLLWNVKTLSYMHLLLLVLLTRITIL